MTCCTDARGICRPVGVLGVDFTSAPGPKKQIVVARALLDAVDSAKPANAGMTKVGDAARTSEADEATRTSEADEATRTSEAGEATTTREAEVMLRLLAFERFNDWKSFEKFLRFPWAGLESPRPPTLIAGFDFPFGLPKELLRAWQWDQLNHREIALRFAQQDRKAWVSALKRFCEPRAPGHKFAHRACDGPAGSSPSMKWVNPPVVFMYREGFRRLIQADWHLPGFEPALKAGNCSTKSNLQRRPIALEAYPGHLARSLIGPLSYKSDRVPRDPQRLQQRARMLERLAANLPFLGPVNVALQDQMMHDGRGDSIDAWLCAIQAAWAAIKGPPDWGAPRDADPQEGWICSLDLISLLKPQG